jgi:transcriptional regulator with GAF, ATPase, and Fis domain
MATAPLTIVAEESSFLHRVLAEQKSVLILHTRNEEGWQNFKGHKHFRSWLSVPLVSTGDYLELLSIGHSDPNRFTEDHLRRARLLAIPAAAAIQNARLYEIARIYGRHLKYVLPISNEPKLLWRSPKTAADLQRRSLRKYFDRVRFRFPSRP